MTLGQVEMGLRQIKARFRRILEDGADDVIDQAVQELAQSKKGYESHQRNDWGYHIDPVRPLRFTASRANKGAELTVDLFCDIRWKANAAPETQDICLRIWSDDSNCTHRENWDAKTIADVLSDPNRTRNGRVMLRLHFDKANQNQEGPEYHLQFGGKQQPDELHWFPKVIDLPRFVYQPMDIVLACEFVAANFYPEEYQNFKEDPTWHGVVRNSQASLLQSYYEQCLKTIKDEKQSLLVSLWNT